MLRIGIDDLDDDLGTGEQTDVTIYIEAELDRRGTHNGTPHAVAQIQCTTGDDAFAILRQITSAGERHGRKAVTDRAELHLHQQRSEACYDDGALNRVAMAVVEVGPNGVIERDVIGDLISHAPMHRFVR